MIRNYFFLPLEWHKNKFVNSYYIHTYGLWGFFLWEDTTLSVLTIKCHYTYFILLEFLVFN